MQYSDRVRRAGMIMRAELKKLDGEWISLSRLAQVVTLNTGIQLSWIKKQLRDEGMFVDETEYDELEGKVRWKAAN